MCSNYRPVTRVDRMLTFFGIPMIEGLPDRDVFPNGLAPMIRSASPEEGGTQKRVLEPQSTFRLIPEFASKMEWARKTFNARSETVAELRTYKRAWADGDRCIIPAEVIFEPRYFGTVKTPGPSERWAIGLPGAVPMGIAGIYRTHIHPETGEVQFAMSMLTVNADDHSVMQLFHRPGHEKRMVVILDPKDYDDWLSCSVEDAQKYLKQWHGPLEISAAPLRATRIQRAPPAASDDRSLF